MSSSSAYTSTAFPELAGQKYLSLTTYRKDGRPVTTPVWFAADGNRVVVMTGVSAGKAKRLRQNANVLIAPCTARGKEAAQRREGVVRFLSPPESVTAMQLLDRKYGIQRWMAKLAMRLRREQNLYLEITAPPAGPG